MLLLTRLFLALLCCSFVLFSLMTMAAMLSGMLAAIRYLLQLSADDVARRGRQLAAESKFYARRKLDELKAFGRWTLERLKAGGRWLAGEASYICARLLDGMLSSIGAALGRGAVAVATRRMRFA